MPRILTVFATIALATGAYAQAPSDQKETREHGSGGTGWSGDLGGARNASQNHSTTSTGYYTTPVATGLDLKGPTKTQGPFAE